MITLQTIQTSLPLTYRPSLCCKKLAARRRFSLCVCSSRNDTKSEASLPSDGDSRTQEVLAQIAMLQAQKVRVKKAAEEHTAYLSKFKKDANAEYDEVEQNLLKDIDEASAKIMDKLDSQMEAIEESAQTRRLEIERNEKILEEFEDQIEKDKNEGLFFKSLGKPKAKESTEVIKSATKTEVGKLKEVTKESAGFRIRRNIYLTLMFVLALAIANAVLTTPEVEWRKVAALGLIFIGLVAQLIYEQSMLAAAEKAEKGKQ